MLTKKERMRVLRYIARCEVKYLGIDPPPRILASDLSPDVLGGYLPQANEVLISKMLVEQRYYDSKVLIDVVLHELHHAFIISKLQRLDRNTFWEMNTEQQCLATQLSIELLNYKKGSEDGYFDQVLEKEARKYAEERMSYYTLRLPDIIKAVLAKQRKEVQ